MTEQDWLEATDPQVMLAFLRTSGKLSERKGRQFAVACCRRLSWYLPADEPSLRVLEVAERFAEGGMTHADLQAARESGYGAAVTLSGFAAAHTAETQADFAAELAASFAVDEVSHHKSAASRVVEEGEQCHLLREIFGPLPFRPVTVEASWRTPEVLTLAQVAYADRRHLSGALVPDRLLELAQALEAAGCTDAQLLGHLRSAGPHVRGCFVVDAVLGKS